MIDWQTRNDLYQQIKKHEGVKLKPYTCTGGYLTIGIGRNIDINGITELEAELMCLHDINKCQKDLDNKFPWWRSLSDKRQMVLMDMCFNLGIGKLAKFKKTLDHIQKGEYEDASFSMLESLWAKQVGGRAKTLSTMMREG